MSNFFAVSGAPGGGKTTVLRELQSRGYAIVSESAIDESTGTRSMFRFET